MAAFNQKKIKKNRGFSLLELLITLGLVMILASATIPIYGNFQGSTQINEATMQIIQTIRIARGNSVDGLNNSSFGVYFEINPSANDKCILYQGSSY